MAQSFSSWCLPGVREGLLCALPALFGIQVEVALDKTSSLPLPPKFPLGYSQPVHKGARRLSDARIVEDLRAGLCVCVCVCVRACVCVCVCVCAHSARGSVFSLHFPVGFQLPRQFRGGPWTSGCPRPPFIKPGLALGHPRSCPAWRAWTAGPFFCFPWQQLTPWEAPTAADLLSILVSILGPRQEGRSPRRHPLAPQTPPSLSGRCSWQLGGPRQRKPHALCVLLTLLEGGFFSSASAPTACARWCPPNSVCVNATACRCNPGFSSASGEIFTSLLESCDDINECGPRSTVSCGKFADCQNTEGSYFCTCSPGYALASGAAAFRNESENTCQGKNHPTSSSSWSMRFGNTRAFTAASGSTAVVKDVDECIAGQHKCHNSTICANTVGSYVCRCRRGWRPKAGFRNKQPDTTCEEMSFPAWTMPPDIKSRSLFHFFERIQDLSRDFKVALAKDTIKKLIGSVDKLMEVPGDLEALVLSDRHHAATHLLSGLEQVLRTLAKAMPGDSFTYRSLSDTELSLMIQDQGKGNLTMGQRHARMQMDWTMAAAANDS
ncbi:LOW QUALITY PROTEIN: hypothetical protein MC885_014110, partial [Smutsia gigantea]